MMRRSSSSRSGLWSDVTSIASRPLALAPAPFPGTLVVVDTLLPPLAAALPDGPPRLARRPAEVA
jgi:hypothetical protein